MSLVLSLILYSYIKANNKVEYIITLCLKLFLICLFWFVISQCINADTLCLFIGSYVLLGFDDFDLSQDVESVLDIHLHKKCIGDPGGPGGPDGGPDLSPLFFMNKSDIDWEKYNNFNDHLKILQNSPALDNYKKYIEYEDFKYERSSLEKDLYLYNNKVLHTDTNELLYEKKAIVKYLKWQAGVDNHLGRYTNETPLNFICRIQNSLYEKNLEYNTLKKAKLYYENVDLRLNKDYEYAFETWQKRQIGIGLDFFRDLNQKLPVFARSNWFVDSDVYDEIIDNLLYTELQLIQAKLVYEGIKAAKFNYFSLNNYQFDVFVSSITNSNVINYIQAYDFINKHYLESFDVYNMSRPGIEIFFEMYKSNFIDCISFKSFKVGIEFSANFLKRDFTLSDFKMMSEIVFSDNDNGKLPKRDFTISDFKVMPKTISKLLFSDNNNGKFLNRDFTLSDFKAISKIIFSDNDNSISHYKKFNLIGHMPKNS